MRNQPVPASLGRLETLERRTLFAAFGTPDADFGVDGRTTSAAAGSTQGVEELLVLSDGRIIAVGDAGLVRFSAAGAADSIFGTSGKASITGLNHKASAVDSSNRPYVLGTAAAGTVILRFTAAGKTDTSFGSGGSILVTSSKTFTPAALAVDSSGRMIVAGTFKTDSGQGAKVRVYRLTSSGAADTSFDSDGAVEFNLSTGTFLTPVLRDRVGGVYVTSGGKILVGGGGLAFAPETYDPDNGQYLPAVYGSVVHASARLNSNGALDGTYGSGGIVRAAVVDADAAGNPDYYLRETIVGGAGRGGDDAVLVVGRNLQNVVVTKFTSGGSLDFTAPADEPVDLFTPRDVVALPDGRAVVLASPKFNTELIGTAAVSEDGAFGNVVFPTQTGYAGAAAGAFQSSSGDLLVGDTDFQTGNYEVMRLDVGNASDPRPDEFADARANDIAQDGLGRLHVAYYDAATTTLKYAVRGVDGRWSGVQTIDGNPNAGQYVALDTNSRNNPGIAYFDGTNGDMKLATFDGSKWTYRTVESKGSVGLYPSLDFDDTDRPTMTYYKKTTGDLRFARYEAATNSFYHELVDSEGDVGRSSVLVASPKTRRYSIAYASTSTGEVKWAGRPKTGGGWNIKVAAATTGGADFISMAYGYYYEPAISYYDAGKADLKLAYFDANQQKFIIKTLATSGAVGLYSQAMFPDYYGQPVVYAYNRSQDRVSRYSSTLAATPNVEPVIETAGRYLSADYSGVTGRLMLSYYDAVSGDLKLRSTASGL